MEKTIFTLELHEILQIKPTGIVIMRVASGWLYDCWDTEKDCFKQGSFVPFADEKTFSQTGYKRSEK